MQTMTPKQFFSAVREDMDRLFDQGGHISFSLSRNLFFVGTMAEVPSGTPEADRVSIFGAFGSGAQAKFLMSEGIPTALRNDLYDAIGDQEIRSRWTGRVTKRTVTIVTKNGSLDLDAKGMTGGASIVMGGPKNTASLCGYTAKGQEVAIVLDLPVAA